jgi:adenylate kinase
MVHPNVLITGTPGTGKTTLAAALAERTGFQHINISDIVKRFDLHDGVDEEFDSYLINEDKVTVHPLAHRPFSEAV